MRAAALFQPADLGAAVCRSDKFGFDFLPADLRLSEADIYLASAMAGKRCCAVCWNRCARRMTIS